MLLSCLPASCFFRMMSAAASLFRCCSVPEALFLLFWTQSVSKPSSGANSDGISYHRGLSLLVLLPGLVSLVAACHDCGCSVLEMLMRRYNMLSSLSLIIFDQKAKWEREIKEGVGFVESFGSSSCLPCTLPERGVHSVERRQSGQFLARPRLYHMRALRQHSTFKAYNTATGRHFLKDPAHTYLHYDSIFKT